ncbi:hypothetical protein D915_009505 [Fasciola hepatica]|uniref:DAD domain-containing protein n=1 Tax=Fasciola hepatica TaxID=6192 RepID=A0A4E0QXC4_FASHE|nr:hypothetical protein D915_009505 [Fasciola hepatica]
MELPSFDLLWQSSEKLVELESLLEEIDQHEVQKEFASKKQPRFRYRRAGLYGTGFAIEDKSYYEPLRHCCDQAFYTEEAYAAHVSGHVPCTIAGCSFVAHPNALRLHKEVVGILISTNQTESNLLQVHDSGYFDKIFRSTTDSSILKWREARKRNYPTIERAAVNQEILAERLARGQVFKTQEFGAISRKRAPLLSAKKLNQPVATPASPVLTDPAVVVQTTHSVHPDCDAPAESSEKTNGEVPRLVSLAYDSDTDDSEENSSLSPDEEKSESNHGCDRSNVSVLLDSTDNDPVAVISSDTECEKDNSASHLETETEKTSLVDDAQTAPQRRRRRRRGGRRRQQQHLDQIIDAPPVDSSNPFAAHPIVQLRAKRRACLNNPERIHSRPTLLHMLLAEEMRTERNQLMQCVRYVVKNNFFLDTCSPSTNG